LRLFGRWKVTLLDEEFIWAIDDTTVSDQLLLENELDGQPFEDWLAAVDQRKAVACQVLIWYLRRKKDPTYQQERFAVDFPIRRLVTAEIEEPLPLPPTRAGSETPEPATSSDSPATVSGPTNGVSSLASTS
jgi:hypothetical protein